MPFSNVIIVFFSVLSARKPNDYQRFHNFDGMLLWAPKCAVEKSGSIVSIANSLHFFIKYFHKTHDIGICRVHRNKTTTELLLQREIRHPSNGGCKKRRKKTLTEHCYYFRRHDNSLEDEQRRYNAFPNVYRQKIKSRDCFSGGKGFCC